jgi:hypothetical protein
MGCAADEPADEDYDFTGVEVHWRYARSNSPA